MTLPPIRSLSHLSFPLLHLTLHPSQSRWRGSPPLPPSLLDSTEGWECGGSNHHMPQWWQHGGLVVALPSLAPTSQSGRQRPSPPIPSQIRSEEGGPQRRCGGLMAALQSPSSHILDPADGGPPLPSHPAGGGGGGGVEGGSDTEGSWRHSPLLASTYQIWPMAALPSPLKSGQRGRGGGVALPSPPSPSQNPNPRSGWRRRAATGKGGGGGFFFCLLKIFS